MNALAQAGLERHVLKLMEDVESARSPAEIYASALACLRRALAIERASILLFDETGTMRFVAWQGLSDAYRRAVDGHSPWAPSDTDANPILVADVRGDPSLAAFAEVFARERVAALAFMPLQFGEKLLGKFMLYYDEPHAFSEAEISLARIVAGHLAFALEHARVKADLERRLEAEREAGLRLDVLAKASECLAPSLDPSEALERLARFAAQTLADYCVAYHLADDGKIERAGLAHADAGQQALVEELVRAGPPQLGQPGAGAVLQTGEPVLASEISAEMLESSAQNAAHLEILRKLGPRSSLIVPLNARGRTLGALAFATTDFSGRKYTQPDVALAQELADRAALLIDNARLYREAREATRLKDEMLAVVSHDLRSPLSSIVTACELLELDLPDERRIRTHASIRRAAKQMNRLLEALLDVTRIEGGRLTLQPERFDVAQLVEEIVSMHEPVAVGRMIRLSQLARDAGEIEGDRNRLAQALSNLIDIALKFTPDGGEIQVSAERVQACLRVCIADTGCGVAGEHLPLLFERFWRAERSGSGSGLGLTISKGIAEAHGGTIEVVSKPGKGSEFTLVLPMTATSAAARSRADEVA